MRLHSLHACLALALSPAALGQSVFLGLEPNESKAQATLLDGVDAGDYVGVTVFATGPGVLRLRHAASAPGILRHELRPIGAIAPLRMEVLGRDTGTGVVDPSSTAVAQSVGPLGGPAPYLSWYGFGRSEELYIDLASGLFARGASHYWTRLTSTTAPEVDLGVVHGDEFVLTASGVGGAADLELHLFDGEGNTLPDASSDESGAPGGAPRLVYTLTPGNYLVAVARHEAATQLPLPPGDLRTSGVALDFKGPILSMDSETGDVVEVRVEDPQGSAVLASAIAQRLLPYEVLWFTFDVAGTPATATFCAGDGGPVPCGCLGDSPPRSGMGCRNSTGRGATVIGRASGAAWSFLVEDLPANTAALGFVSTTAVAPSVSLGGLLCLGPGFRRVGVAQAGAAGSATLGPFDPVARGFLAGQSLYLQAAYRDTLAPLGCAVNTTAGYRFVAR